MEMVDEGGRGRKRKRSVSPQGRDQSPSPPRKTGRMESLLSFFSPRSKTGEQTPATLPLSVCPHLPSHPGESWTHVKRVHGGRPLGHGMLDLWEEAEEDPW